MIVQITRTLPRWAILHKNADLISYCEADWQPVQLNEAQRYMFMPAEVENHPGAAILDTLK